MDATNTSSDLDSYYTGVLPEQDMDQELKKLFKEMAEAVTTLAGHTATAPPRDSAVGQRLSTLEERSNWHRTIGWGIAGVAGVLFAGLITWYLPGQLANVRDGVKSDTAAQLLPLQIQLAKLAATAALKESKNVAEAIQQSADFSTPKSAIEAVKTIALQARAEKLETPPSVLKDAHVRIQQVALADPALADEAWSATLALIDYRSALPSAHDRAPAPAEAPRTIGLPLLAGMYIHEATQKLDGAHWKDATFENSRIEYAGGPIELENVRFINCTFVMKHSPSAESLADLVLSQNGVWGTIS